MSQSTIPRDDRPETMHRLALALTGAAIFVAVVALLVLGLL